MTRNRGPQSDACLILSGDSRPENTIRTKQIAKPRVWKAGFHKVPPPPPPPQKTPPRPWKLAPADLSLSTPRHSHMGGGFFWGGGGELGSAVYDNPRFLLSKPRASQSPMNSQSFSLQALRLEVQVTFPRHQV